MGQNKFPESIIYLKIPPSSSNDKEENLEEYFPEAKVFLQHVEEIGGRVFVHCFNGISRSAAVVLRYLIEQHHLLLYPLHTHILNCRPVVELSKNFKLQLAMFEYRHLGRSSVHRHAGAEWDFYEWNRSYYLISISLIIRIKSSYGKQNSVHIHTSCGCVIQ